MTSLLPDYYDVTTIQLLRRHYYPTPMTSLLSDYMTSILSDYMTSLLPDYYDVTTIQLL